VCYQIFYFTLHITHTRLCILLGYTARDRNGRERLNIVWDGMETVLNLIATRGNGTGMDLSQRDGMALVMIFIPVSLSDSDRNVSVRPSGRLSVTRRYCVKTKNASVMISSPSGSPKTLVFWRQISQNFVNFVNHTYFKWCQTNKT